MRLIFTLLSLSASHTLSGSPSLETYKREMIRWEGLRFVPYVDGKNFTSGIGHNLNAHREKLKPRYSTFEVDRWFYRDLAFAIGAANAGIRDFDSLPDEVQLLVIGLVWTVGPTGFKRFINLRRALSWRAYEAASIELLDSKWAIQVSPARVKYYRLILQSQP